MEEALHLLGIRGKASPVAVVELLEKGFTKRNYLKAKAFTGFTHKQLAGILSVSTRLLEAKKNEDRLSDTASERLLKLAEIAAMGNSVFGNDKNFREWLQQPLMALGGKCPVDLMVNMYGLDTVKQLLGRIEHGVYS